MITCDIHSLTWVLSLTLFRPCDVMCDLMCDLMIARSNHSTGLVLAAIDRLIPCPFQQARQVTVRLAFNSLKAHSFSL